MKVLHTAVWVSDIDRTTAFYTETLDLAHTRSVVQNGVLNYFVGGDDDVELQFKYDETGDQPVEPGGIDHLALEIDDVDDAVAALERDHDIDIVTEPTTLQEHDVRFAMVTDPDGYVVELISPH